MNKSAPPERLTDFVGQDYLLEETIPQSLRRASGRRPVVLLSVLGSGATAVAVEYLHRTYPRYYAAAEWIDCGDGNEIAGYVGRAMYRFREVGGPALLVLDGVTQPERVSALLPAGGPDILITSSADPTAWPLAERVLKVTALMPHDSVRLLCRYEPGLPKREAELLASRLDHSPEALAQVGKLLSRRLSARQVLGMSHAELLELLCHAGPSSHAVRIGAAVAALAPEWCFAQDLLRAFALIGSPVFPSRNLGRLVHHGQGGAASGLRLPVALLVEALELLSQRGLLRFSDDGIVELLNLPAHISLLGIDAPTRARAEQLVEAIVVALDPALAAPNQRSAAEMAVQHLLALKPDSITTAEGRAALVDLCTAQLATGQYNMVIDQLSGFRAAWDGGGGQTWEAALDRYLAQAYEGIGNFHEALTCMARAVNASRRCGGEHDRLTLADSYAATRYYGMENAAAAIPMAEELERQQVAWLGEHDRETLRTGSLIARLMLRRSITPPEVVAAADQAMSMWRIQSEVLGKADRETLETRHLLGEALEATGRSSGDALVCFREAESLRTEVLGKDHPDTIDSRDAYLRVGRSLGPFPN
ncbi:hypothetical protein POF50_011385 [Streptomyces sp. SL13]|uniref:Tetratricopeptide repeat protein n=1 Tax=Streptantibioticus silvisoli TaxID=2705255 RepID=A0AA90H429_9ACTN|nr:hypothetical protein [Streptantibioticus silvisoli]MDI5969932.1 hypothetical protein [Streptantibioticus silvisoli]